MPTLERELQDLKYKVHEELLRLRNGFNITGSLMNPKVNLTTITLMELYHPIFKIYRFLLHINVCYEVVFGCIIDTGQQPRFKSWILLNSLINWNGWKPTSTVNIHHDDQ